MQALADGQIVRAESDRTVYALVGSKACAVQNAAIFAAHGWDFANVIVISSVVFSLLERGPPVNSR